MSSALRSIRSTCVPRPDVLAGGMSDNQFAAQLDKVVRDPSGYEVYSDADRFFDLTYPTSGLKQLIAKNIEVERPKMNADSLAELVLTFFTGLSMEHNLSSNRRSIVRKIDDLMNIVRTL